MGLAGGWMLGMRSGEVSLKLLTSVKRSTQAQVQQAKISDHFVNH